MSQIIRVAARSGAVLSLLFCFGAVFGLSALSPENNAQAAGPWQQEDPIHGVKRLGWTKSPRKALGKSLREDADLLTRELAQARRQQIASVDYSLNFEFTKGAPGFYGKTQIVLSLNDTSAPLSIDAVITRLNAVRINGQAITDFIKHEHSIEIPAAHLSPAMVIEIEYYNDFNRDGQGLMSFTDPVDGREYIFSDSEPYGAHTYFPCFDQPDLKATYTVSMRLPAGWRGISNNSADREFAGTDGLVQFPASARFSTYILFIGAGEYDVWRDSWNGLPMAIYARKSLSSFMDAANIFRVSKAGLQFFSQYFGFAYPFPKYDHIFVPEFGPGAMENPGAVTMNERMIHRGPQTPGAIIARDNTILHEMAHHWFGDLTTMAWWDDLWLNESFATYMASLALDRALGLREDAWVDFSGTKVWARWQDQLPTTHPIIADIPDTDASGTIFDGITYGKGAAVLQQLHFAVGETAFMQGVQNYFQRHAWSNATHADFVRAVGDAAGRDLGPWASGWLATKGLNRVKPVWSCNAGLLQDLALEQGPTVAGMYLPHATKIGLYRRGLGRFAPLHVAEVHYSGPSTSFAQFRGLPCPDFVYANVDDHDYAVVELDLPSQQFALSELETMPTPLMRVQIWSALDQLVDEEQVAANEFLRMAARVLPVESSALALGSWMGRHATITELYWGPLTVVDRDGLAPLFEANAWAQLQSRAPGDPTRYYWLDHLIEFAHSTDGAVKLEQLLQQKSLDQERRWQAIVRLSSLGHPGVEHWIEAQLLADPSDSGRKWAFAARVAAPTLAAKEQAWRDLTDRNSGVTWSQRRVASKYFHNPNHPELTKAFVAPYFHMISQMDWTGEVYMMRDFFQNLFPRAACDADTLAFSEQEFARMENSLPTSAKRAWREANHELERCIKLRARNQAN